jgi:hypothetical protein
MKIFDLSPTLIIDFFISNHLLQFVCFLRGVGTVPAGYRCYPLRGF